jgi:hypothetical protein
MLAEAAIRGGLRSVQTMLDAGLDVDLPGEEMRMSALHSAAWWGNLEMVDLLLRHGASVAYVNDYGGVKARRSTYRLVPRGWVHRTDILELSTQLRSEGTYQVF